MLLKTARSIKLPEWIWLWLDKQEESRATLIEEALKQKFKLKEPDKNQLDMFS